MKKEIIDFMGNTFYKGDELGTYIWGKKSDGTRELIAVVNGYREDIEKSKGTKEAELFQDELGKFISDAINEKIKRETK